LDSKLERWWTDARKRVRKLDRKRFDSMVIITAWTLWKQRDARVGTFESRRTPYRFWRLSERKIARE
jgi:hypothetical protein